MKLYIAGPMTGLPDFNHPAFHAAAAKLRSLGYEVANPAEICPDTSMPYGECMRLDIREMTHCDGLAMLPDWHLSRGAMLEVETAKAMDMQTRSLEWWAEYAEGMQCES
jgi:hypothetical protein